MGIRQRKRALPFTLALQGDYAPEMPPGFYREISVKVAGSYTGSGAGIVSLDGGFGFAGRPELNRGGDAIVALQGTDLRWLSAACYGAPAPLLPSVIAASGIHSALASMPFDAFIPGGGIQCAAGDVVVRGKLGAVTNLGTTVTAITGLLQVGGETTDVGPNGDHYEPRWLQQTVDISAANAESKAIKRIGNDEELCAAIMVRVMDASLVAGDPNTARSDGFIRTIRVELESKGQTKEVCRYSWGEAKALWTHRARLASADVPSGVVVLPIRDPSGLAIHNGLLRMVAGDTLTVFLDTAATIEAEFTAATPAAGDTAFVSFIDYVPRGRGVDAQRRARSR